MIHQMRSAMILLALFAATRPLTPAEAASASVSATGTVSVIKPLSISSVSEMNFGRLQPVGSADIGLMTLSAATSPKITARGVSTLPGSPPAAAVRIVRGEPNRVYRISLPTSVTSTPGGYLVSAFTLESANQGDITSTLFGRLNPSGSDTLFIGGTIGLPKGAKQGVYAARIPITLSYE